MLLGTIPFEGGDMAAELIAVHGGTFLMGSDRHYPDERPRRPVTVEPFRIERTPVTNLQFAAFVAATGYVTEAERRPDAHAYPGVAPDLLVPGSVVFVAPEGRPDPRAGATWWRWTPGADWSHPTGPGSSIRGLEDHPVVHVAYADAAAYAAWLGRALPTEAQWEHAARGGLDDPDDDAWDEPAPHGVPAANTWRGEFPYERAQDGIATTSPVGTFPPNGFGLLDMIGNVWEWTSDWYGTAGAGACCGGADPAAASVAVDDPARIPRKVLKGGSHLCAPNWCARYRPSARVPEAVDTGTSHIGFRCVAPA
jgi:formylglycine-generating enzyme